MDRVPDFESVGCGFESRRGRLLFYKAESIPMTEKWTILRIYSLFFIGTILLSSCKLTLPPASATQKAVPPTTMIKSTAYFVDGNAGSDSNPGIQSQPWQTIQKAADTLSAGDVVTVNAGIYPERVYITRSGSPGSSITFQTSGAVTTRGFNIKANYITLRGFEITDTPNNDVDGRGIYVQGTHCNLEGNYIYNATRGGILLTKQTDNCSVSNNRLYHNSQNGIEINGQSHLIESNEIWGTIQYHPNWANPPSWVDADGIRLFGSGHIIRKNYIHDIPANTPENINPHIDCFQTWQDTNHEALSNVIIEQNTCLNVQPSAQNSSDLGSGFQIEDSTGGIVIRNNFVYSDAGMGIVRSDDVSIVNNHIIGNTSTNPNYNPVGVSVNNSSNILLRNNILFNQTAQVIYVTNSNVQAGNNMAFRNDGEPIYDTNTYDHSNDLWDVNPLFVGLGNYHLQATSPAIDFGFQSGCFSAK